MIELISIGKCLLFAKFINSFEPLKWLINLIPDSMPKWILLVIATCFKCASFWTTLIYTGDIFLSCLAFYIAILYDGLIKPHIEKININNE